MFNDEKNIHPNFTMNAESANFNLENSGSLNINNPRKELYLCLSMMSFQMNLNRLNLPCQETANLK